MQYLRCRFWPRRATNRGRLCLRKVDWDRYLGFWRLDRCR
ncbi:hypothetical protein LINPERPRIM_LOCUS3671 [Linum perenne]